MDTVGFLGESGSFHGGPVRSVSNVSVHSPVEGGPIGVDEVVTFVPAGALD